MNDHGKIVRVEMEYADGAIQRLEGPPAEAWLEDVDSVIAQAHIRYSKSPIETYPWKWTKSPA
jgi:hypothetical protein